MTLKSCLKLRVRCLRFFIVVFIAASAMTFWLLLAICAKVGNGSTFWFMRKTKSPAVVQHFVFILWVAILASSIFVRSVIDMWSGK